VLAFGKLLEGDRKLSAVVIVLLAYYYCCIQYREIG
jgi:hypothetical protein